MCCECKLPQRAFKNPSSCRMPDLGPVPDASTGRERTVIEARMRGRVRKCGRNFRLRLRFVGFLYFLQKKERRTSCRTFFLIIFLTVFIFVVRICPDSILTAKSENQQNKKEKHEPLKTCKKRCHSRRTA